MHQNSHLIVMSTWQQFPRQAGLYKSTPSRGLQGRKVQLSRRTPLISSQRIDNSKIQSTTHQTGLHQAPCHSTTQPRLSRHLSWSRHSHTCRNLVPGHPRHPRLSPSLSTRSTNCHNRTLGNLSIRGPCMLSSVPGHEVNLTSVIKVVVVCIIINKHKLINKYIPDLSRLHDNTTNNRSFPYYRLVEISWRVDFLDPHTFPLPRQFAQQQLTSHHVPSSRSQNSPQQNMDASCQPAKKGITKCHKQPAKKSLESMEEPAGEEISGLSALW